MNIRGWRWTLGVLALLGSTVAAQPANGKAEAAAYGARDDVMRFAAEVAARHGELDASWLRAQLQRARFVGPVQKLIMPPPSVNGKATVKNWAAYRARFVERERIDAGVTFWRANASWLQRAEARWGVPAQIIVGVIGVETYLRTPHRQLPRHRRAGDARLRLPHRPPRPCAVLPQRTRTVPALVRA